MVKELRDSIITLGNIKLKLDNGDLSVKGDLESITDRNIQRQIVEIIENMISSNKNIEILRNICKDTKADYLQYVNLIMNLPSPSRDKANQITMLLNDVLENGVDISDPFLKFRFYRKCAYLAIKNDDNAELKQLLDTIDKLEDEEND